MLASLFKDTPLSRSMGLSDPAKASYVARRMLQLRDMSAKVTPSCIPEMVTMTDVVVPVPTGDFVLSALEPAGLIGRYFGAISDDERLGILGGALS